MTNFAGCGARENSSFSGNPAKENQTAATLVSAPERDAAEPAIASAPDGSVYVVWAEHLPEKQADVFIRRFDTDQKPLGEAVRINPQPGKATAWRGDPPTIKVGADGTVYVGWTARVEVTDGSANNLYLSVSRDIGKTFDAPVKINDDSIPASHGMHSLEVDKNGRVYAAWLDERYLKKQMPTEPTQKAENDPGKSNHNHAEPNGEVYFAVSNDGGNTFSANKKIAENACPCCKTSMAVAPDGRLYLSWRQVLDGDFRHIAVSSSADGGNSFAPKAIVSDDKWQIAACPVSGAGMTVDSENKLVISWFTAGEAGSPGLYQAESKDGAQTFSPRRLVSDKAAGGTPLIMSDEKGGCRIIFSAIDKNTYTIAAPNAAAEFIERNKIIDSDLPGAALSKGKIFIAFIRKTGEKRNIFLFGQNENT